MVAQKIFKKDISFFVLFFMIGLLVPNYLAAAEPEKSLLILDLPSGAQVTKMASYFAGKGEERACWIEVTIKNVGETPRVFQAELLLNDIHSFAQKTSKPLEPNKETILKFASYLLKAPAEKIYLKLISNTP